MSTTDALEAELEATRARLAELETAVTPPVSRPPANIIEALARCMTEMPGVAKDQEMNEGGQHYRYRGIESITSVAQRVLGRNGVVIVPEVLEEEIHTYQVRSGNDWYRHTMKIKYRLYGPGGPDDRIIAGPFTAIANDPSDKSTLKCMTQAFKMMLLQVLCIGDNKDDPDSYGAGQSERATTTRSAPLTLDEIAVGQGWESAMDQENAKQSARRALSDRTARDEITKERATELFREYQRPDGDDAPPRLRSRLEHLAWWVEHSGQVDPDEDNPLDPPHKAPVQNAGIPQDPAGVEQVDLFGSEPPPVAPESSPDAAPAVTPPETSDDDRGRLSVTLSGQPFDNGYRDALNETWARGYRLEDLLFDINLMDEAELIDRVTARGWNTPAANVSEWRLRLAQLVSEPIPNPEPEVESPDPVVKAQADLDKASKRRSNRP